MRPRFRLARLRNGLRRSHHPPVFCCSCSAATGTAQWGGFPFAPVRKGHVDDIRQLLNVETARGNVSADEEAGGTVLEGCGGRSDSGEDSG